MDRWSEMRRARLARVVESARHGRETGRVSSSPTQRQRPRRPGGGPRARPARHRATPAGPPAWLAGAGAHRRRRAVRCPRRLGAAAGRAVAGPHPDRRPRRARPGLHPRVAAAPVAARLAVLPRRGARPRQHPRGGRRAARRQPLGRQPDAGHRRLHARLLLLLRRRAALLPAGPQPRAVDAGPVLPAQVRDGRRVAQERAEGAATPAPRCSSTRAATTRSTGRSGSATGSTSTAARASSSSRSTRTCRSCPSSRVGGQETSIFLSRGEGLAKLLRLDKAFRLKVLPISLALPVGRQRRRHARPLAAAGQDHGRGAAADRPARGVRRRPRPRRGLRPRHPPDAGHPRRAGRRAPPAL